MGLPAELFGGRGPTRWRKVSDTVAGFLRADGKLAPIYAVELSDEEKNALSDKLLQVKKDMKVVVRYFVKAAESTGKYISLTGTVVMIDPVYRELKVMQDSDRKAVGIEKELPVVIPFDDIADLSGEGITNIEDYLGIEKYPDDI